LAPSPAPPARATGTKNKPRSPRLPQDSAFHRASTTILVHPSNHQPLPQPASTKAPKHHSTHTYRLSIVKEQAAWASPKNYRQRGAIIQRKVAPSTLAIGCEYRPVPLLPSDRPSNANGHGSPT